ncbi:MAG: DNA-deoxyinosine glycosylase, partial [Betaproteobacteria bacterium]|nr:DNA-deoxyinosine glycosylase [Betaproteobacteria bacterium]
SETANDISGLLARHPAICAVALNGGMAKQCFMRHVKNYGDVRLLFLPSTSPANARMNFSQKVAAWRQILPFVNRVL